MSDVLEFRSKTQRILVFLGVTAMALLTLRMASTAITNDRGLIINHLIPFSVNGATILYWIITLAFLAATIWLLAAFLAMLIFGKRVFLRLDTTEMHVLKSTFRRELTVIPYAEITGIHIFELHKQTGLLIQHLSGKTVLSQSTFKDKAEFIKVCQFIAAKSQIGRAS